MAKIIYGFSGEGSGHSTRTREVSRYLISQGHELRLASYDRGFRNLSSEFDVLEIEGLTIGSENNQVSLAKTFTDNLRRLPEANRKLRALRELFKSFQPHAVITDFEPMTGYLAHHYKLPLISLDNQHRMRYTKSPIPPGLETEARMTRAVIRAMVPKPDVALITTFVKGEPKSNRVFQFSPMVELGVRQQTVSDAGHILVYLTSGFDRLLEILRGFTRERFRVFGSGAKAGAEGPLEFCEPGRQTFLADLASCRAVIATAGFTLISEALFLGKPYLAYPMQGQYEQQLNAYQLEQAGYGRQGKRVDRDEVAAMIYEIPQYRQLLSSYPRGDNQELFAKLDSLLADSALEAQRYRRLRKT